MKNKVCVLCHVPLEKRLKLYCKACKESGNARKDILKKYNHSHKARESQAKYRKTDLRRLSTNKYNRSEKGKEDKLKYYRKNREAIIKKVAKKYIEEIKSRTAAHDLAQKLVPNRFCFMCFSRTKIVTHHIDGNPFNNETWNLAILCSFCHGLEHEEINQGRSLLSSSVGSPQNIKELLATGFIPPSTSH